MIGHYLFILVVLCIGVLLGVIGHHLYVIGNENWEKRPPRINVKA